MLNVLLLFPLLFGQPTAPPWTVTFDPAAAGATGVHWIVTLTAPYCGGYTLGDGVHISPEAPLALPAAVAPEDVLFASNPAAVSTDASGALVVNQAPNVVHSQICMQGERALTIELLPTLGLTNPDPGTYTVDVWTGADPEPVQLPVTIDDSP